MNDKIYLVMYSVTDRTVRKPLFLSNTEDVLDDSRITERTEGLVLVGNGIRYDNCIEYLFKGTAMCELSTYARKERVYIYSMDNPLVDNESERS